MNFPAPNFSHTLLDIKEFLLLFKNTHAGGLGDHTLQFVHRVSRELRKVFSANANS